MWRIAGLLIVALVGAGCRHRSTYAEGCGPLPTHWRTPRQGMGVLAAANIVSIGPTGRIRWNGVPLTESTFSDYLGKSSKLNPLPATQLIFSPHTDCDTVTRFRKIVSTKIECGYQVCAEGSGKMWLIGDILVNGKAPAPFDPSSLPR